MEYTREIAVGITSASTAAILTAVAGAVVSTFSYVLTRGAAQRAGKASAIVRSSRDALLTTVASSLAEGDASSAQIASLAVSPDLLPLKSPGGANERSVSMEALVGDYHLQALSQAQVQFWFSVVAATTGFAWILYAATNIRSDNPASAIKTLPGVVMDAVAFLFFKQAAETRQRATELYDRLRIDKLSAGAILLADSIDDATIKSTVKAQMALHMSGVDHPAFEGPRPQPASRPTPDPAAPASSDGGGSSAKG